MTSSQHHQDASGGLSHTFDQVDFARRRVAELIRASEIPDGEAVANRLERSASHCWCFWIAPQPALPALLISGEWNLSAFVLLGMFERVEVWETDEKRAEILERVAAEVEANLRIHHCPPAEFSDRLMTLHEPYGLAAMQDSFGLIPRRSRAARRDTLHGLAAVTAVNGQCCVVGRNRFSVSEGLRLFGGVQALPTPAEVSRQWAARKRRGTEVIFFHPDHHDPVEVLFRSALLPTSLRKRIPMRLLEWAGVIERALGAFASFHPLQRGKVLVDQAASHWRGPNAATVPAVWRDCSIKENAMLFLTVALADGGDAIVRIPLLREAADALARSDSVYAEVARTLPDVSRLIPESRPLFGVRGWPMHIERKCRGVPARMIVRDPKARSSVRAHIAGLVNGMCAATVQRHVVDEQFIAKHYRSKFSAISAVETDLAEGLSLVEAAAFELAQGRTMPTVRIHGDLNVSNVFVDHAASTLTGLIDWETSLPGSMPFDLIHYLIAERRELDSQPWGALVARAIAGKLFDAEASDLLHAHFRTMGLEKDLLTPLLVGYWARGVALRQTYAGGRVAPGWREKNLTGPLISIKRTLVGC